MPDPTNPVPDAISRVLQIAVAAGAGAIVTLVAFRTRFALMEQANETRDKKLAEWEQRIDERLAAFERRQIVTLQILADVAKKVGVDGRMSDALVRFLTDEASTTTKGDRRDD